MYHECRKDATIKMANNLCIHSQVVYFSFIFILIITYRINLVTILNKVSVVILKWKNVHHLICSKMYCF